MDANEFLFGKKQRDPDLLRCGHRHNMPSLGVVVTRAGVKQLRECCSRCMTPMNGINFSHSRVPDIDAVPVVQDNRDGTRCEVCGSGEGVEYHHWAPFHLFGDEANMWPGFDLCRYCHQEWHRTTRTGLWWKESA